MKSIGLVGCLSLIIALGGCSAGADDSCKVQSDCVDGYVCYQGKCEKRDHLVVETDSLPNAVVGVKYQVSIKANGGVEPYSWTLDAGPEWLSVNNETGSLFGTAEQAESNVLVGLTVTDSSDSDGHSTSVTLMLTVVECVDGSSRVCFEVQSAKCMQGTKVCASGKWDECSNISHSSYIDHCGPDCGRCDAGQSDGCYLGSCTCGDGPDCVGGQACCVQHCVDVTQDDENCGACGLNCKYTVQGATGAHCENGRCDYDACDDDRLDCDADRSNGCETTRGKDNCSFCAQSCDEIAQHATGIVCSKADSGEFNCDYDHCYFGFYDCDSDRSNACETQADTENCTGCGINCTGNPAGPICVLDQSTQSYRCGCTQTSSCVTYSEQCCDMRCVSLDDPAYCGDCFSSCSNPLMPACVDPYSHGCGCLSDEQCGTGFICCEQNCIPIDEQNCGICGRVCDAKLDHGSRCDTQTGTCYCEGYTDCRLSDYAFSTMRCVGGSCRCEQYPFIPTYPEENIPCCNGQWIEDPESNPDSCGQCGVQCAQDCINSGCTCSSDIDCPKSSPAIECNTSTGTCICPYNPTGNNKPCRNGRACCNGMKGGTGGPDGGPDLGCCWYQCSTNEPGDCNY